MSSMSEEYLANEDFTEEDLQVSDNSNLVRYVTFLSDGLIYAIDTGCVTEIITNATITAVPMVPYYITGIINLRGAIVPILDIRARMNKVPADISEGNRIIVLDVNSINVGIIIDEVLQVLDVDQTNISSMPASNRQELVNGMTNLPDGTTLLFLDCELLVNN